MKNLFLAAGAALALLASCSKHTDEIADSTIGSVVKIAFVDETPQTRAFFGTTAAAESGKSKLGRSRFSCSIRTELRCCSETSRHLR